MKQIRYIPKGCRQNVDPPFGPLFGTPSGPLSGPLFFLNKKNKINKYIKKRKQTNDKVPYRHSVLHILP